MNFQKAGVVVSALLALLITGCSGSDNNKSSGSTGGSGGGGGGTTAVVDIGSGTGAGFVSGALTVAITSLSAGGSTSVTANLVDTAASNVAYLDETSVQFTSTCAGTGLASLTSPITTSTGVATSTYTASGCSGADTITAIATIGGDTITATGSVTVAPAIIGSIQKISVSDPMISLKGIGGTETSRVTFKVMDNTGGPVAGQLVEFALNTGMGDTTLSHASATSDSEGLVSTLIQSGTVSGTAVVTATITALSISTMSNGVIISTGVADQDSFSLSIETLNPEAWIIDGVTVPVTVRMADRMNNPVPDGTAAYFTTEGGSIEPSCITENGACSVNWVSMDPRPADGRVTILVTAIGEESFHDVDSDGVFSDGDSIKLDLPEAYRDDSENSTREGIEPFADFDSDGVYDFADGLFNGVLCTHATLCSTSQSLNVRDSLVLVMAGSTPFISGIPGGVAVLPVSYSVTVTDINGNTPPLGSTIAVEASNGVLVSAASLIVPNNNSGTGYTFGVAVADDGTPSTGALKVIITTPSGAATYAYMTIVD